MIFSKMLKKLFVCQNSVPIDDDDDDDDSKLGKKRSLRYSGI